MSVEVLAKAVREAGRVVWEMFINGEGVDVERRREGDVTRRVDAEAESVVLEVLKTELGDFTAVSEEIGVVKRGNGDLVAVVDPLDGSGNFSLGIPYFAVMVAAGARAKRLEDLTEAAIYMPAVDRLYTADPRRGVLINGAPARFRETPEPTVFVELGRRFSLKTLEAPLSAGYKVRSGGCAGCQLLAAAMGVVAGYIDIRQRLGPWDVAAPLVVGRYNARFRYCIKGDLIDPGTRVDVVGGDVEFVEKMCSLI